MDDQSVGQRSAVFAALGEPIRLALVDRLVLGDRAPGDLASDLDLGTNLLAHHLRVLEEAGVIRRVRSEGDRRRSYVQLRLDQPTVWAAAAVSASMPDSLLSAARVVFVCTANSARSQIAAATWNQRSTVPAASGGTHPGPRIHPRAVTVGRRHGLHLERNRPMPLDLEGTDLVIAVCDNAHEELDRTVLRLHWSIPDPVPVNTDAAFERAYADISRRVHQFADLYATAEEAS